MVIYKFLYFMLYTFDKYFHQKYLKIFYFNQVQLPSNSTYGNKFP